MRSLLADWGVNGALFFLVKLDGLVCYWDGALVCLIQLEEALFSSGRSQRTYTVLLKTGGALSIITLSELSSVCLRLRWRLTKRWRSSLLERSCLLLPRVTWIEFSSCFRGWDREDFSLPFEGRREDETSLVKAGSLEGLHPFFLIVSSLPCVEEEEQEEMVRNFLTKREGNLLLVDREVNRALFLFEKLEGLVCEWDGTLVCLIPLEEALFLSRMR